MGSKKTTGSKSNNDKGNQGDVGKNAANSENMRKKIRTVAKQADERRKKERENGSFYLRVNDGRFTSLLDAGSGVLGSYAYPGGNLPSVHFNVQREAGRDGPVSVIRLETIQEGHEHNGVVFDPAIFLPCWAIEKFGLNYRSRMEGLAARTQEFICHFMAYELGLYAAPATETADEAVQPVNEVVEAAPEDTFFKGASIDMRALVMGAPGIYGRETEEGRVRLQVFLGNSNQRPNLKVVGSTMAALVESTAFVPVHLLFQTELAPLPTVSREVFDRQKAIHAFIRSECADLVSNLELQPQRPKSAAYVPTPSVNRLEKAPVQALQPVPAVMTEKKPAEVLEFEVDVSSATPFTARQFISGQEEGIFSHEKDGATVWFRAEKVAGNRALTLIAVEDAHPLSDCWLHHDVVRVHLQTLSAPGRPYGDVTDVKNAREMLRQYLREVGMSLGVRPKQKQAPADASAQKTA